jgi:hypothetical protein
MNTTCTPTPQRDQDPAVPAPLEVASAFEPIGLADMVGSADLQDRVDVKYLVRRPVAEAVLAALSGTHGVLEIEGERCFRYATTYYDSIDLRSARDHLQGRRRRFKCRSRHYVDTRLRVFEVKLKGPRGRTVKHALVCDEPAPDGPLSGPALEFVHTSLEAAYGLAPPGPLLPVVSTTYRRMTFAAIERGERLTLDIDLDVGGARLNGEWALLESKSRNGRALADRLLREHGVRPAACCSKYVLGAVLAHPRLPRNAVQPLLRRCFDTA